MAFLSVVSIRRLLALTVSTDLRSTSGWSPALHDGDTWRKERGGEGWRLTEKDGDRQREMKRERYIRERYDK